MARAVAERIQVSLTTAERSRIAVSRRQVTPAAYEAYVRGTYFYGKAREADHWKGIGYFRKAIEADPTYAMAYAGMANSYTGLGYYGTVAPEQTFPKARVAALKALELDSTLAAAHLAIAYEKNLGEWDFAGADREFRRALEFDPTSAQIHWLYGMYLTAMNRSAEAITEVERAQALDPSRWASKPRPRGPITTRVAMRMRLPKRRVRWRLIRRSAGPTSGSGWLPRNSAGRTRRFATSDDGIVWRASHDLSRRSWARLRQSRPPGEGPGRPGRPPDPRQVTLHLCPGHRHGVPGLG